jgi:hypothetical protein
MQTSTTLATQDTEAKLNSLTTDNGRNCEQGGQSHNNSTETKESLQKFIEAWKSMTQQA